MLFKKLRLPLVLLLVFCFISLGCGLDNGSNVADDISSQSAISAHGIADIAKDSLDTENHVLDGDLVVSFVDVGQGDCIFIQQGESCMLVDAGDNQYEETVVQFLKDNNVQQLEYVVGTHPHADHIGGLDAVINSFSIGKVIMPRVTHTSKTFEDVLTAIKEKGLKITTPHPGDIYKLGAAEFTVLAPNSESYDNLNNYSVVLKLVYGDTSFLLTGDAESLSEQEILAAGYNIKANVLKQPHHGSNTSCTDRYLNTVSPQYAVIMVGEGNDYGHPHQEILTKLEDQNIEIFRTDLHGTIIATSDGKGITFKTNEDPKKVGNTERVGGGTNIGEYNKYIGNKNSKVFHKDTCSSLPLEKNRTYFNNKENATQAGYRACQRCNP